MEGEMTFKQSRFARRTCRPKSRSGEAGRPKVQCVKPPARRLTCFTLISLQGRQLAKVLVIHHLVILTYDLWFDYYKMLGE